MSTLEGRVALVTGGARGIGKAISETLYQLGASVVIADNGTAINGDGEDPAVAEAVASELGERAVAFTDSIADATAAQKAVALAVERFGAIDIVVNNAAILRDAFIFKGNPEDYDRVIKNNLAAAYYVINAATGHMRQQVKDGREPGRITNIVSSAGLYGNFGQSAYASAKAGLFGLTRVVSMDMARSGVTCNAVAPFAATRVTDIIQPANDAQATYKERALKIAPQHVANLVAYLSAPEAESVTGQLFGVRGREVFLFSQPRPVGRIVREDQDWDIAGLAQAVEAELREQFTDASTDLEAFNTEPYV